MTDWRVLPAGRELDRLIAERLGVDLENSLSVLKYWSTDANAALSLLNSLPHQQGEEPLSFTLSWSEEVGWIAHLAWIEQTSGDYLRDTIAIQDADTPALAIARAWLGYHDQ